MKEEKMEERIIAYLLGECDEEEAFEMEKMCRENPIWQAEKIRFSQVLGLMEEATDNPTDSSIPENERQLSKEQRAEIKSLLQENPANDDVNEVMKEEKKEKLDDKPPRSKVVFWAPLAAAAMSALLAYFGSPEKQENKDSMYSAAVEPDPETQIVDSTKPEIAETLTVETEIALQEAIADGANEALALRTSQDVKKMEQQAVNGLPDGKQLARKMKVPKANPTLNAPLALLKEGSDSQNLLADAFSQKIPEREKSPSNSTTLMGLPKPKKSDIEAMDKNLPPALKKAIPSVESQRVNWSSLINNPAESFIFNNEADSLGKIRILSSQDGKILFERANWPNKNRSFELEVGVYEIRLADPNLGTLILKGEVQPMSENGKYELTFSEVWELDQSEKRKILPLEKVRP